MVPAEVLPGSTWTYAMFASSTDDDFVFFDMEKMFADVDAEVGVAAHIDVAHIVDVDVEEERK